MRLGTCIPYDETVQVDGRFNLDKSLGALTKAGIRGCLTNFPADESRWEESSQVLACSLKSAGVTLLEYNTPFPIETLSQEHVSAQAHAIVRLLAIAESIGCFNVATCVAGPNGINPHLKNRTNESWDLLKEACEVVADDAAEQGLHARLLLEPVYTTIIWSPLVLARLIDEVGSPLVQGHMDLANCLSFDNIFDHAQFTHDAFTVLGNRIHSAHLKDVAPIQSYLPGLEERLVGDGVMDLRTYLECLSRMPSDFPVLIEHMRSLADIERSYQRIEALAKDLNISVWKD